MVPTKAEQSIKDQMRPLGFGRSRSWHVTQPWANSQDSDQSHHGRFQPRTQNTSNRPDRI